MDQKTRILIAEDSAADAELIARELGKGDFAHTSKWVKSRGEFLQTLEAFVPDIILCDYNMPGFGAPEALEIIKERLPATPLIVISGTIGEAVAVEMLKAGATDYVMKNNLPKLTPAIKRALKEAQANTERKELEKELARAKEIQFRTLIENLPGKVFLKDRNSVYISCNEYYAKDLGIKSEEVAGKTDYGFFPTHLAEKYRADDKHVMESGETKNVEEEYATIRDYLGNFQTGFVNMVKSPIRDDAGNVTGVLGFFWDITERKKSEEAIRLLNQQMEYVLEATHTGLDIIDSQFNLKYVDSGWQKVYGDFGGRKCYEYFMDRKEKCPGCGIEKALEKKKAVVTEEILAKEGNRCVQVTTIPFQDKAGDWLVAEVNVDITERKKAEQELKEAKALLEAVVENVPLMIFLKEAKALRFVIFNRAGEELLGYDRKALLGKNNLDLFPPEQAAHFMAKDREVLDGELGVLDIPEEPILTAKKGQRLLHTRKVCIRGADGITKFLLGISEDITDQKIMEAEKKRVDVLAAGAETKNKFASMVSHELRSPLAVIKGSLDIFGEGLTGRISDEQKDVLDIAKKNVDRLGRLINDVLDFQKIEAGAMEFDFQENDMNEMVLEVHKSMSILSKEKHLDLRVELEETLPKMRLDRDKLLQVLMNLAGNAITNTEAGSITLSIQKENDGVHVRVRDTGKGIPAEELPRLFQPFKQVDGKGHGKKGGTGLGLAISKEIVLAHHGKIWAESEAGKGCTVHVVLPVQERRG